MPRFDQAEIDAAKAGGPKFSQEEIDAAKAFVPPAPEEAAAAKAPKTMLGTDGRIYDVPASGVEHALGLGWREATEEDLKREKKIKAGVEYEEQHRVAGGLARFGNELAFGVPELIEKYRSTPEQNELNEAIDKRYAERHGLETGAEKVFGFAGSLAVPGVGEAGKAVEAGILGKAAIKTAEEGAAKAATASLSRKVLASSAKYASEAALYSSPTAAVQAAYGDHETAAETMLWGIGLGGALGAGGKLVSAGAAKAAAKGAELAGMTTKALSERQANGITRLDDIARNVLGINDAAAKKLGPTRLARIVARADEEGILSADPKVRPKLVQGLLKDAGGKLGEHREALEGILSDPEMRAHGPVPTSTAQRFNEEVGKLRELGLPIHEDAANYARKLSDSIAKGGSEPSFEALQSVRQGLKGGDFDAKSLKGQIARLADHVIESDLESSAQKLYQGGAQPERFADYLAQKERYEAGKALEKGINEFKGTGRLPGGLKSVLGLSNITGIGLGVLAGHPGTALAGLGAKYALNAFLDNKGGLLGKSVSYLRKAAADPESANILGGLLAKEGATSLAAHLDALPSVLSGTKAVARGTSDAVQAMIGPTSGLSKDQQYDKLVNTIQAAHANPQATADNVGAIAQPFLGTGVQLGSLVAGKKLDAIAWLQTQIPKDPSPPQAFQRVDWKPSKRQKAEFLRKVAVVHNPMSVWDHYLQGSLSPTDRDTLQAVYPRIYQHMVQKILETAYDPRAPALDHAKRMQLSMFTGQPMDPAYAKLGQIQQSLAAATQTQQTQGQPSAPKRPSPSRLGHGPSLQTDSQRRSYGGSVGG